jgi:hypothetical protein
MASTISRVYGDMEPRLTSRLALKKLPGDVGTQSLCHAGFGKSPSVRTLWAFPKDRVGKLLPVNVTTWFQSTGSPSYVSRRMSLNFESFFCAPPSASFENPETLHCAATSSMALLGRVSGVKP